MTKLLVCGSRDWGVAPQPCTPAKSRVAKLEIAFLRQTLTEFHEQVRRVSRLVHGAAQGADTAAADWARHVAVPRVAVSAYPADWARWGRRAGPLRNRQMLTDAKPDVVMAFVNKPLDLSRGTNNMVELAREAQVQTIVVERFR